MAAAHSPRQLLPPTTRPNVKRFAVRVVRGGDTQHLSWRPVRTGDKPLLTVAIHEPEWAPALMALCAGYELGKWREEQFVDEIFGWLPSFVLPWSEQQETLGSGVAVDLLREAARRV